VAFNQTFQQTARTAQLLLTLKFGWIGQAVKARRERRQVYNANHGGYQTYDPAFSL